MIDTRGQRVAATLTTILLAAVLLTGNVWLLLAQAVAFALGVVAGPASTPSAWVFRTLIRPRLGPPAELEPAEPARFAQLCGLSFASVGLLGAALGSGVVVTVAVAFALAAAFLNAAFGFCLGCEMYLRLRRAGIRVPTFA